MSNQKSLQWIEEGYLMISRNGFSSLKIETIARSISKNKSSFYHYFGDVEVFEEELLKYHIYKVEQFAGNIGRVGTEESVSPLRVINARAILQQRV